MFDLENNGKKITRTKYALDGFGNMYDLLKPTAVKKWTVLRKTVSPTTFMFLDEIKTVDCT